MSSPVVCLPPELTELRDALVLVRRVFWRFVAPCYSEEGCRTFMEYASADGTRKRLEDNHRMLIATVGDVLAGVNVLAGVIEVRGRNHISLLFVDESYQRRGVARALVGKAFPSGALDVKESVTVNASPNSVAAYEKLGFQATGTEQTVRGLRFVPMRQARS